MFRLRPFIALLKLLRHPQIGGYLTDHEIAAAVIGYATSHADQRIDKIAHRVLSFRKFGLDALDSDFADRLSSPRSLRGKSPQQLLGTTLKDIANTFVQWLQFTGYASPAPGKVFGVTTRTVTAVNESLLEEIDDVITFWSAKPLIPLHRPSGKIAQSKSEAAFQRTYGVSPDRQKDQRTIAEMQSVTTKDRITALVSASLSHLFATEIIAQPTPEVVRAIVLHTGIGYEEVRSALNRLIPDSTAGWSAFLDRYEQMAFSGTQLALDFEKATTNIIRDSFKLDTRHVGQAGATPDIEVWSNGWSGIVDTKAYASYDLPLDHQLRMISNYLPAYSKGIHGRPLSFFLYVSGGFSNSINAKLLNISDQSGIQGAGIGIRAWIALIRSYLSHRLTHDDLLELWTCGRVITNLDIQALLNSK